MADTNYPEEGDLVIATITKIQYHSIFCDLVEYGNQSAMIHISEVAPGRIRNLNDYVKEGKSVVAKVLRTDANKGHIDLSIRRVTDAQRKQKAAQRKQEKLVENMLEQASQELDTTAAKLREQLTKHIPAYELYETFVQVTEEETTLQEQGINKEVAQVLERFIKDRIKAQRISIKGEFTINSYASDGIARIRAAFKELPEGVEVYYRGAGVYAVAVTDKEYKQAEKTLAVVRERVQTALGSEAEISFSRTDKK